MMPVNIKNVSSGQHALLRFNSGLTRRLAPGETLEGIADVEIKGSAWIARLRARRVIALVPPSPQRLRSRDMKAEDAIEHIRRTPRAALEHFLSPDESRVSVRRAMEEKEAE